GIEHRSEHGLAQVQSLAQRLHLDGVVVLHRLQAQHVVFLHLALVDETQTMQVAGRLVDGFEDAALGFGLRGHWQISCNVPSATASSNCFPVRASRSGGMARSPSNSASLMLARSFFSKPNTKNQRWPSFVATSVLAPPRLPRPASPTRFFTTPPPRSASINPATISSTALHR